MGGGVEVMEGGQALDALLSAEAEVAQLQKQLADLDTAIESCNQGITSITDEEAGERSSGASDADYTLASSITRREERHRQYVEDLRCDTPSGLSSRLKHVDSQLEDIRARRRALVEQEVIQPSSAAALRKTWSRPRPILLQSKRTLLRAQALHLDYTRARKHAIDRLGKRPSLPKMGRSSYPKWQRPTYDFVRSIVTGLLDDLLHDKVLDVPPDIGANYDSAITAAENLKASWALARELEEEVIAGVCRAVAVDLIDLRDFVDTQVRAILRDAVATNANDGDSEVAGRLDLVMGAMRKARSRSFYCIKHSQSISMRRRQGRGATLGRKVTMHPSVVDSAEEQMEVEDHDSGFGANFTPASKDGIHPIQSERPTKRAAAPVMLALAAAGWKKDPSREWRTALSQSLAIIFSPSRRYACLLAQHDFAVMRFKNGEYAEHLTHDPLPAKATAASWSQNEQALLLLHSDATASLWHFNCTQNVRGIVCVRMAQRLTIPTTFDGLTLTPSHCHFLPHFSLLGDQMHILVLFTNGDMLPLALPTTAVAPASPPMTAAAASRNSAGVNVTVTSDKEEEERAGDTGGGGDWQGQQREAHGTFGGGAKRRLASIAEVPGEDKEEEDDDGEQEEASADAGVDSRSFTRTAVGAVARPSSLLTRNRILNHLCRAHHRNVVHFHWCSRGLVTADDLARVCVWKLKEEYLTGFGWMRPSADLRLQLCRLQAWPTARPITRFLDPKSGSRRTPIANKREQAEKQFAAMNMSQTPWNEERNGNKVTRVFRPANVQEGDFTSALLTYSKNKLLIKFQTQQFTQQFALCNKVLGITATARRNRLIFAALFAECYNVPCQVLLFSLDLTTDTLHRVLTIDVGTDTYDFCSLPVDQGHGLHFLQQEGSNLPDVLLHCGTEAFICRLHYGTTEPIRFPSFIKKHLHELKMKAFVYGSEIVVCLHNMVVGRAAVLRVPFNHNTDKDAGAESASTSTNTEPPPRHVASSQSSQGSVGHVSTPAAAST